MRSEQGTVVPLAAGLAFVAFVVLGLVTDVALLHGAYRRTALAADAAVEAGAAMIDETSAYDGNTVLSALDAGTEVRRMVEASGLDIEVVEVDVADDRLCIVVTTTHRTVMLATVGLRDVPIEIRTCAQAAIG